MNKKIILSHMIMLSISASLSAGEVASVEDFESLLNDVSNIATKKSINVDYLPSVVTVIDSQTFIDGGVQNIGEALAMLPGIQVQLSFLGQPITNVRGFKNPNSIISDKVKVLVDGVAINNEASGTSGFYMDFPMQLVEKIEVLRGPGSTVYGAGAFYGAVNIITKLGNERGENQLYLGGGSYKYKTAGTNLNTSAGDWKIHADAFYAQNDKSITNNEVTTKNGDPQTDEAMQNLSLGVKVANGGFEFLTRYKSSHYGNFYAFKGDIEPNHDKGHEDTYFFSQLSYKTFIDDFKLETKLNYSNRESDLTAYFDNKPLEYETIFASVGIPGMQDAFYVRDHQVERNIEAEAILTLPEIASNDISIGVGARKAELTTNDFYSSIENAIAENWDIISIPPILEAFKEETKKDKYWEDPTSTELFEKTTRTIKYAYIQDLIAVNADTDIVLGARADNYSDIGTNLSSRAGLVYRVSDELVLKLLYGSAFRAPTFYEAYTKGHIKYRTGDENLLPEETNTYEAALVYSPDFNNKFALNVYYSKLSNVIDLEEHDETITGYQNMKDRVSRGVEFEYFFRTQTAHNLYLNATYINADYTVPSDAESSVEIDQSMPDISKIMYKAMYIYHPINQLSFGTSWQYYSETTQTKLTWIYTNPKKDSTVDQQHIVDETITYRFSNLSCLRFTIKNLFNKEIRLPSMYYHENSGVLREGRNYFLSFTQKF